MQRGELKLPFLEDRHGKIIRDKGNARERVYGHASIFGRSSSDPSCSQVDGLEAFVVRDRCQRRIPGHDPVAGLGDCEHEAVGVRDPPVAAKWRARQVNVAVKVIDDGGNELLVVKSLAEAE